MSSVLGCPDREIAASPVTPSFVVVDCAPPGQLLMFWASWRASSVMSSAGTSAGASRRGDDGRETRCGVEGRLVCEGVPIGMTSATPSDELATAVASLSLPMTVDSCAVPESSASCVGALDHRLEERHRLRKDGCPSELEVLLSVLVRVDEEEEDEPLGNIPRMLRRREERRDRLCEGVPSRAESARSLPEELPSSRREDSRVRDVEVEGGGLAEVRCLELD